MASEKPYRLRIPPGSPRYQHVMGPLTFKRGEGPEHGWYPIDEEQKAQLQKVPLFDMSPGSPPLFQIVPAAEALTIDRSEARKGSPEAIDAELRGKLAAAEAGIADLGAKFDRVLAALGTHADKLPPELAHLGEIGKATLDALQPKHEEERPPRPGAKPPKGSSKPEDRPKGSSKPEGQPPQNPIKTENDDALGAKAAVEGIDAELRGQGFTVSRTPG